LLFLFGSKLRLLPSNLNAYLIETAKVAHEAAFDYGQLVLCLTAID
jgi:hypothetical protein